MLKERERERLLARSSLQSVTKLVLLLLQQRDAGIRSAGIPSFTTETKRRVAGSARPSSRAVRDKDGKRRAVVSKRGDILEVDEVDV